MSKVKFTSKHICEALDIPSHHLRNWTKKLKPYCLRETRERSATRYLYSDLLFFSVIKYMLDNYHFGMAYLIECSEQIHNCITSPHRISTHPFLFIPNKNKSTVRINRIGQISGEGVLIDLNPAKDRIVEYLGMPNPQTELSLGLSAVKSR